MPFQGAEHAPSGVPAPTTNKHKSQINNMLGIEHRKAVVLPQKKRGAVLSTLTEIPAVTRVTLLRRSPSGCLRRNLPQSLLLPLSAQNTM